MRNLFTSEYRVVREVAGVRLVNRADRRVTYRSARGSIAPRS